jgi:hypothetical protein
MATSTQDAQRAARGASAKGLLSVDVCGVAMFLPDVYRILVIDGRKPRVSVTDKSMIPAHIPMIGIQSGTYEPPATASKLTFEYDVDGNGAPVRFDAFMLDGHTVSFGGVKSSGTPVIGGKRFASMKELSADAELCSGVRAGCSRQVVGTIDFSNARTIRGKPHGKDSSPLKFGHKELDVADMAAATFEATDAPPTIHFKKGDETLTIELTGNGPWRVMVGNFPVEEIVGTQTAPPQHDAPLTHLELYYDLYHVGRHDSLPIPTGANHLHARTANGRCGPTLVPEPVKQTDAGQ